MTGQDYSIPTELDLGAALEWLPVSKCTFSGFTFLCHGRYV
jgi:hypothetical protein